MYILSADRVLAADTDKRLHDFAELLSSETGEKVIYLPQPLKLEAVDGDLRDQFAMAALTGLLASSRYEGDFEELAIDAMTIADNMLGERL
jgi:hypothetical protein